MLSLQKILRDRYYMNPDAGSDYGKMTHGWKRIDDSWMFFDENGHMMTGWIHVNNTYYYLGSDGKMVSGTTITIDGNSYTFDANGAYTGGGNIAAKEVSVRTNTGTSASSGSSSVLRSSPDHGRRPPRISY